MRQETSINIELQLAGNTAWKKIEELLADIGYTCDKRGYRINKQNMTTTTSFKNKEESFLSVEDMKI